MKTKFTQIKTCSLIASLSALVIAAQAQNGNFNNLFVSNMTTLVGGSSSDNVNLLINNDGVGTMLLTPYSVSNASPVQEGLGLGAAFLRHANAGVVYVDSDSAKLANDSTSQGFFVNSSGGMDIIDDSGVGLHLDGTGHLINDDTFTLIGGPSSRNVNLFINNDGVGTMLLTPFSGTNASPVQEGIALGAAFLRYTNAGVVYVDSNSAKLANDGTRQMFLVNSGGRMDMIDASGTGLHLDGSGHLINDKSFSSDAGHFVSDGSGNVATYGLATTVSNTIPATSIAITNSPFYWTNITVRNVVVYVDGLQGSVGYNGGPLFGSVNNAPVTVMLQPGAYVTITNSVFVTNTPAVLRWHPF